MSTYEPDAALVEVAARAMFDTYGQHDTDRSRRIARAVLRAVGSTLLARGWDEGVAEPRMVDGSELPVRDNPWRAS